jgi:transposase-like protein
MSHVRYCAEVRQHALSLVLDSHLPVTRAAQQAGCSVNSLHYWLKKKRKQASPSAPSQTETSFIPIQIVDSPTQPVEIVTATGITIRLTEASPQYLAELLLALTPSC